MDRSEVFSNMKRIGQELIQANDKLAAAAKNKTQPRARIEELKKVSADLRTRFETLREIHDEPERQAIRENAINSSREIDNILSDLWRVK